MLSANLQTIHDKLAYHARIGMPMTSRDARLLSFELAQMVKMARLLEVAAGSGEPPASDGTDNIVRLVPRPRVAAPASGDVA